ncbi:hypothetical protein FEM48_Zijuj04G0026500 [Ziziphus jujuba var. spinosa]|uniref:PWWP domain-containing protein n=1 Tax=Ziziphus jujuba var. spinosa TaxID=714518 RepID=A0A978VHD1_ZIZJJ|nr:hypothetical protein FEM48_Zijuj04G0026500 [Ziziphus jujuba var. spinosa]
MGTVETRSKSLASSSIRPPTEPAKPQVSGEKNLREVIDGKKESRMGLRSTGEGRVRVNQENGVKESVNGKQGLDDDGGGGGGSRVLQTKISVSGDGGLPDSSPPRKRLSARRLGGSRHGGRTRSIENSDEVLGAKPGIGDKIWLEGNGISLNENRKKEPYGKLRTIEVPIAETSENNDGEVEDANDEQYEFTVGDFVWGKVKSHPWWPGQIYDPSYASDYAAKIKPKDRLLVAYFGDGTFAWCQPSQLKPFEKNFVEMSKQSSSKAFLNAVQQAVDEIGRLLELKMTCSCVPKENRIGLSQPSAANSGVKEGILVPEAGIGKLSALMIEPDELLAGLKRAAQIMYVNSVLELRVIQSRLSAFYRSKGGYQLPQYHEPEPTPGLEEDNWKSVEVPTQGPFEDWLSSPIGSSLAQNNQSSLQHSPPISESRIYHRRKQKSIADIMERDKDSQAKTKDKKITRGDKDSQPKTRSKEITREAITGKQTTFSGKKKRKGREESDGEGDSNLTSETGRGRKARFSGSAISADTKTVQTNKKIGNVVKEETKKGVISRRRKNDAVSSEHDDGERTVSNNGKLKSQSLQRDDNEVKGQTEKGILSRERKKSKYLSPPFTNINSGKRKRETETESLLVSNEAQIGKQITKAADNLIGSPQIVSCSAEKHLKTVSIELPSFDQEETSHGSSPKTITDDQKEIVDPTKVNVAANEMLSQIRSVAVNLSNRRGKKSFEVVVDFISIFRNSIYRNGSNYKLYNKRQPRARRKILDSESELPGNDPNQTSRTSPENESKRRRTRNKEEKKADKLERKEASETLDAKSGRKARKNEDKKADKREQKVATEIFDTKLRRQKPKQAGGTSDYKKKPKQGGGTPDSKTKDKKTDVEASPAVLFVTFGPGSSLPTKADLIRIYGKYGDLDEAETDMFYNNFFARVSFTHSSDAEKAFSHSQNANPFGTANVTFRLQYLSSASKTRELSEISSKKESPPLKPRDKTPKKKSTPQPSVVEASELDFIKQKLEMMTSMLENSDKKISPKMKSKLEGEMKGLLEKVNTMVTSSS